MTAWTLAACREREAKYRSTLAKIPGGVPTMTDEDRRELLALVERMRTALDIAAEHAHVPDGEDGCDQNCPGCEADELLEEIDGGERR